MICPSNHTPPDLPPHGQPYSTKYCRFCWKIATDERYRNLLVNTLTANSVNNNCIHLLPETGELVLCPSCTGHVELKLRGCELYGDCTTHKPVDNHPCCQSCLDYQAIKPAVVAVGRAKISITF